MVIDLERIDPDILPEDTAISAITLAEITAGPHAVVDREERARRQDRVLWAASRWDPLPFDVASARAYGRIFMVLRKRGRHSRRRFADLLIAATALAHDLPLFTRDPSDFDGLETLIDIHPV